ncbi:unnamed protein product [Closterium sp. NIES-53]
MLRLRGDFVIHPELDLWPRVSSPRLRWTGKVGDSSVFRVWDVIFDKSVPFYRLFPYCSAPLPPLPLFVAPGPPLLFPLPPQGPAPSGVSQVNPPPDALDLGAARGTTSGDAELGGAGPRGAELGGAETGGAEPGGVETGGAALEGAESGGAERQGAASSGATRAGGAGVGGAGIAVGAGVTGGTAATGPGGARTRGLVVLGVLELETLRSMELLVLAALLLVALELEELELEALAQEALELEALAWEVLELKELEMLTLVALCDRERTSFPCFCRFLVPRLLSASPLRAPSTYTEQSGGLTQRCEPASRPVSPVRTAHRVPHTRPPPIPSTHAMTLQSDRALAVSPNVSRLLATAVTDPSFESAAASALVAELLDFATAYRLDYASALVAESASASPPSVGGECALGTDVLEDRQEDFQCLATAVPHFASMLLALEGDPDAPHIPTPRSYAEGITDPYSSQWQGAMDVAMAYWKSTGTYVDAVPPSRANIVDGMKIFRVKRPPGSPPAFKARYVARGFSQQKGVDYLQNFPPTPKMTTLQVLLHVAAQRDYEWHSLDFTTAFLQGSLHEEIWLRRPRGFTESFPAGLLLLLFLRIETSLPPFYVLMYVEDLVFAIADTEALTLVKSELQKRHTCTDLGELRSYLGLQITWDRARYTITLTQSHMVHQVLQHLGLQFSSPQPTPLSRQ